MEWRRNPEPRPEVKVVQLSLEQVERARGRANETRFDENTSRQLRQAHRRFVSAVPTRQFGVLVDGEPFSWCDLRLGDAIAQVEDVGTAPEHTGQGYASGTVLGAAHAAGDRLVFLIADADDWPHRLYERLGFEAIGRRTQFLRRL